MRSVVDSVARGLPASPISRRNFITTTLVVLAILALFFIPEIISFQESFRSTSSGTAALPDGAVDNWQDNAPDSGEASDTVDVSTSPLDRILVGLENGAFERKKISQPASESAPETNQAAEQANVEVSEQVWKIIGSRGARRTLADARSRVTKLLKDMRDEYPLTRYALLNFQNGLGYVNSAAARKSMNGYEAVNYVEQLQFEVTQAMLRERVGRVHYMNWTTISLFPLFAESRTTQIARSYVMPFNPQISLTDVQISVRHNKSSHLRVKGTVSGNDIKGLALFRNGVWLRNLVRQRQVADGLKSNFSFTFRDATGKYTVRAIDKFGTVLDKNYVFIGGKRGWVKPALVGPDPRFDRIYAVGMRRS